LDKLLDAGFPPRAKIKEWGCWLAMFTLRESGVIQVLSNVTWQFSVELNE